MLASNNRDGLGDCSRYHRGPRVARLQIATSAIDAPCHNGDMKAIRVCVVVALVAVVLTGCKGPATDSPLAESAPSPSATSTPTQERETGLVAPKQVFGGDCNALFTADEVSQLVGFSVPEISKTYSVGYPYVEQHGGIRCIWWSSGRGYVDLVVLPSAAVSYSASTGCGLLQEEGWIGGCALEASQNGILLSGGVFQFDADASARTAAQTGLLELFTQRAIESNAAPLPMPAAGSWSWPVDCAAVVASGEFSAVPGFGSGAVGSLTGGSGAYNSPGEMALWPAALTPPYCELRNGDLYVWFDALGGGRWAEANVSALSEATTIAVDGVDKVVISPIHSERIEFERTRVDAFDGPNWVTFYVRYPSNAGVMAQALVAALDTTAIE